MSYMHPLTTPLVICAALALFLCHWSWRRRSTPGSTAYAILLASIAGWMVANIGEKTFDPLAVKVGFANLQYMFAALTPAAWYLFACRYSGRNRLAPDWFIRILFIWPFAFGALLIIDPWTRIVRESIDVGTQHVDGLGTMRVLVVEYGPVFWAHVAYTYSMFVIGGAILLDLAARSAPSFRNQILFLLSIMALPVAANAAYISGFRPLGNVDLTPFALTITCGLGAWGFPRAKIFDLVPRARDAFFHELPHAVFVVDAAGRVVDFNRSAEHLAPTVERMTGQKLVEAIPWLAPAIENGQVPRFPGRLPPVPVVKTNNQGAERYWEVSVTPVGADAAWTGKLIVLTDITERRRWEKDRAKLDQAVAHSQKLESLGVLAGEVAHDFNNILVSILGNAELAIGETEQGTTVRRLVEKIESSAEHAGRIVQQLLAYSGKRPVRMRPLALGELIESMDDLLRWTISRSTRLEVEIDPHLPWVNGDPTQIRQVVLNLVSNACDAIGEREGHVKLSVRRRVFSAEDLSSADFNAGVPVGECVAIGVTDDGCGMDDRTRRKLFEPFFTTKDDGHGLGLSAVLGIVRAHRGAIWVTSEVGKGSQFLILLSKCPTPSIDLHQITASAHQPTVLVVDDEEAVLTVTELALRQGGYDVIATASGEQAIALANTGRPIDAVILDHSMPVVGGPQVLGYLQSTHPDLPVIMTSGFDEETVLDQLLPLRPAGFLRKPYRAADVLLTLDELLRARRDSETAPKSIK